VPVPPRCDMRVGKYCRRSNVTPYACYNQSAAVLPVFAQSITSKTILRFVILADYAKGPVRVVLSRCCALDRAGRRQAGADRVYHSVTKQYGPDGYRRGTASDKKVLGCPRVVIVGAAREYIRDLP
jgi:hypothetical protein